MFDAKVELTADQLRAELASTTAELIRIRDLYQRLLRDQAQHDRDMRAAAARIARDELNTYAGLLISSTISAGMSPLNALTYQVGLLGDRANATQVANLKQCAARAGDALAHHDASADRAVRAVEAQRAQVATLRALLVDHARTPHPGHAPSGGRPGVPTCRCSGCTLIRDMDTGGPDE